MGAAALLAACSSGSTSPPAADTPSAAGRPASGVPSGAPSPTEPPCTPAPLAARAAATLVVGLPGVVRADEPLAATVVGLGVSGVFLSEPNVESAEQVVALTAGLRQRAGRPLLMATDEESGKVSLFRDLVGKGDSPRTLARTRSSAEVEAFARDLGGELRSFGVDLDLAPVADLDAGPAGGIIGSRSFSADPAVAAEYSLAFSRGLAAADVTPTVKHFPGQGRSTSDTHVEEGRVSAPVEELRTTDLVPFQAAIDAGVPVVMVNHLVYDALDPSLPASLAAPAYALLREMGFRGVAITDSLGMNAVNGRFDFPEAAVRAVLAGADAVLATDGNQAVRMRDALVAAVAEGRLSEERLDEAAGRVTALAGGDTTALVCETVVLPSLGAGAAPASPPPTP